MKFVDREEETSRLQTALSGDETSLIVVYGRRRLGKTTLVKRVLTGDDVYFLADRSEGPFQRALLARVMSQTFPDFDKVAYPDWESLFRAANYRADKRFTLCLDEFPYMVKRSPELPSVLQKLIDGKRLKYNIVVCGSSLNMMYGLFLDASAPLYGRANTVLRLAPLRLQYIQEALETNPVDAIEEYAVWGGVPRYWELRQRYDSLQEALWSEVLSADGTLYEEPIKLFQDDVKDIVKTSTIMSYIGEGVQRMTEIASRCQEPSTNLSRPLRKLIDLGFLERDMAWCTDEAISKKRLYKIADPFLSFYFRFVVPNRSFIELGRHSPIEQALSYDHFSHHVGLQWKRMCRDAVTGNKVYGTVYGRARRWWGSVVNEDEEPEQIEIDVVAESLNKKSLLVGECKWTAHEDAWTLTGDLLRKARLLPFASRYKIVPVLFLKNAPENDAGNTLLPRNVIELCK